jgi:hypothetical protein
MNIYELDSWACPHHVSARVLPASICRAVNVYAVSTQEHQMATAIISSVLTAVVLSLHPDTATMQPCLSWREPPAPVHDPALNATPLVQTALMSHPLTFAGVYFLPVVHWTAVLSPAGWACTTSGMLLLIRRAHAATASMALQLVLQAAIVDAGGRLLSGRDCQEHSVCPENRPRNGMHRPRLSRVCLSGSQSALARST